MNYIIIVLLAILVGVVSSYLIVIHAELQKIRELLEDDDVIITGDDDSVTLSGVIFPKTHDGFYEFTVHDI